MKSMRILAALLGAFLGVLVGAAPAGAEEDGFVSFTEVPPYSSYAEIFRRMGTPPDTQAVLDKLAAQGQRLAEQPIDPARERYFLHVPPEMPAGGYNLLVWVWPFDDAILPRGWGRALDKHGTIFIAAERSGNNQPIESRRAPLALIAAFNMMKRYQINPDRVFIGGFSGGSRTSQRLALAFPDLFRGAIVNASTDPLPKLTKPPEDLYKRFLETGHLVFITGVLDALNIGDDLQTMVSLRDGCMFRFDTYTIPNLNHAVMPAEYFEKALRALLDPPAPDNEKFAKCISGLSAAGR